MFVHSQSTGLVLSGGGAKGLAHIGVIRALEENEIPIDYIVGNSIGAIIGGLYAIGYSPDEMSAFFASEKFTNYYRGKIPDEHFYYFKTTAPNAAMFNIGISMEDTTLSIVLPTNLIPTQPMDFGVMEVFAKYSAGCNYDFDSLFVPFRCIGADIYNSREKVFSDGDLGLSIRASMTFPFYFKPIEIDGTLFFDGGIFNNFPVDVMREEFFPDLIIGSVVTSRAKKPNPDDLLLQIENLIMGEQKELEIKPEEGFTIVNDLTFAGLLDFHLIKELESIGYASTIRIIDSIKSRIDRTMPNDSLRKARESFKSKQPEFIIDSVNIIGVGSYAASYIQRHFSLNAGKQPMTLSEFESKYYKLVSDFQIAAAMPVAKYNNDTEKFFIDLHVNKEKPLNVLFGANISSGFSNQAFIGAEYRGLENFSYLISGNVYFGRLYSSIHLGARLDFTTIFPFALESSLNLNRWDYYRGTIRLFSIEARPPYMINYDNNFRVDFITPIENFSVLKVGGASSFSNYEYFNITNFIQTDTADYTSFYYNTAHVSLIRNNHNFRQYPNKGTKNLLSLRYVTGRERNIPGNTTALTEDYVSNNSWFQFQAIHDSYVRIHPRIKMGYYFELMLSNKPFFRNYVSTILSTPAFTPTPHTNTLMLENYRANRYLAAGVKPIILITEKMNLRFELYLFNPYRKIIKSEPTDRVFEAHYSERFAYRHFIGSAAFVYNTAIGPVSISANYYETDNISMYYMFHFGYILFNKRGYDY